MVQADYGYEKLVANGITVLRIQRSRSAFVAAVWMFAIIMSVVLMLIATQINNGRGGPPPGVFLIICAVLIGIAILCSFGRSYTTVSLHPDKLTLNGGDYAKRDIRTILVCQPGTSSFTATSDSEAHFKQALRDAVASQSHYVTFDYGTKAVVLADKMTGPLAERVGSEVATWLEA